MATLSVAARNAALQAISDLAEIGFLPFPGFYWYGSSNTVQLSFITLMGGVGGGTFNAPSGGSMTTVDTAAPFTGAINDGTIDSFRFVTSDNVSFVTATVGLIGSGADIELTGTNIRIGQKGTLGQITLTI